MTMMDEQARGRNLDPALSTVGRAHIEYKPYVPLGSSSLVLNFF